MEHQRTEEVPEEDFASRSPEDEAQGLDHSQTRYVVALAEAFSFGYSEHHDNLSERSRRLFDDLGYIGVPFGFAEARGSMAALVDKLFMRRDRLEHTAVIAVLQWVQRLAAVTSIDDIYKILTRLSGAAARAEILVTLQQVLRDYPDLASDIAATVADLHATAAAEGTVSAGAVINQHRGVKVPDLVKTHSSVLAGLKKSATSKAGVATTVASMLGGLAGDLSIHVGAMQKADKSEQEIKSAISSTLKKGAGAAFFIGAATHSFYANAQLEQIVAAGEKISWVSVGDALVCAVCLANASGGPYTAANVPEIPQHGNCRCWYAAAGSII